jgi:hypothetical protein
MAVADALHAAEQRAESASWRPLALAAIVALLGVFGVQQTMAFRSDQAEASVDGVRPDSWNNPMVSDIATWMDANLPPGSAVLTSRLYFSSIHVQTDARFRIRQLPTVRVDITPGGATLPTARSNLFRWEDSEVRASEPGDQWLYLKQYPGKDYWVGLSQAELLDYIAAHDIEYIVLSGEDVAFSSVAYVDYFSAHPAFHLMKSWRASAGDQAFAFSVDRSHLSPIAHSTVMTPPSFAALAQESGLDRAALEQRLGTPIRVTDTDRDMSDREAWAAVAGIDLGLR